MRRYLFSLFVLSIIIFNDTVLNAQTYNTTSNIQNYYINTSIKIVADFGKVGVFNWRTSAVIAVGAKYEFAASAYQLDLNIYQKGLGSQIPRAGYKNKIRIDLTNTLLLSFGINNDIPMKPLYVFNTPTSPALIQLYDYSLTFGTNKVFMNQQHGIEDQRIGFVNFNIPWVQILYYNDGPPFHKLKTGDAKDRWWTGGALFHFGHSNTEFQFILGYDKFTGYAPYSYELANDLKLDYVTYPKKHHSERKYNIGQTRYNLIYNKYGLGASFVAANSKGILDFQNFIHAIPNYPYHPMARGTHRYLGVTYNYYNVLNYD
ncbi:polymorphic toxin type 23 domain-containing protein [Bacteroidota bacterium]